MSPAIGEALFDQIYRAAQIDEPYRVDTGGELCAVTGFQRRAAKDDVALCGDLGSRERVQPRQPGFAIGIGKWCAGTHFRDVRKRMETVRIMKCPAEPSREQLANGRLACAGDTHDDDDGGRTLGAHDIASIRNPGAAVRGFLRGRLLPHLPQVHGRGPDFYGPVGRPIAAPLEGVRDDARAVAQLVAKRELELLHHLG